MKIVIVAGGTLGHISPGLVIAKELSKKHDVIFITSLKDQRFNVFKDINYIKNIYYIDSQGFNKNLLHNINTLRKATIGSLKIGKILKDNKVELVIGMGGYISGIGILTANLLKLKTIIHEQNKVMGLANKVVLNKVNKILLTFDMETKYKEKTTIVSNPSMFIKKPDIHKGRKNILITSGSNGAKEVNDLAIKLINSNYLRTYHITLVTGKKYYDDVKKKLTINNNVDILPFTNNMKDYIYKSNIIISRAGSSTIFESIGLETVPLLIPSKNVVNNHQHHNASEIVKLGLGEMIKSNENLIDNVLKIIRHIEYDYDTYIYNIRRYKEKYSLDKIIEIIEGE